MGATVEAGVQEATATLSEAVGERTGTVTFLFTDIEGSTTLLQQLGDDAYREVLADHDRILRSAVSDEGGEVFGSAGDAIFGVFDSAVAAARAAATAQRALAAHAWPEDVGVRVRMAVHTGEAVRTEDGNYTGLALHRVARIESAAWGGQVLLSQATAELVAGVDNLDVEDLGEHRLEDLSEREHLYQLVAEGLEEEFPALRSLDAVPNNLPTQLTSFVGRKQELDTAARLLEDSRLLTLTGPGGTGKTRLALRLAFEVADRFPEGVFFVDLSSIFEPELVASQILTAFGLPESGKRPAVDRLISHLAGRQVLVVLDNFEQVLDASDVVSGLLAGAPELRVVVTSRAPLRLSGEQEFPVPPLRAPDPAHLPPLEELGTAEAVALFVERASAVRPGFRLDEDNAEAVATIARRLDGLPLAIELAAARTRLLTPGAIADRLEDRLRLLASGGSRDLPQRQRTLRGTIEWSWELLEDRERRLLARLSVFLGGASLEAVESVCAEDLDADLLECLSVLVDHSLVRQRDVDGQPRFDLLETIREFALERLEDRSEAAEIRARHLRYFLELAEEAEPHLTGPEQAGWLDRLEREHDNLRTALTWAIEGDDGEAALRMVSALWRFWQMRGHLQEGRRRIEAVLAMPHGQDDPLLLGRAHEAAGGTAYWMGDFDPTIRHYERSLQLYREAGEDRRVAYALYNMSFPYAFSEEEEDYKRSLELLDESLAIFRRIGDRHGEARAAWAIGDHNYFLENYGQARRYLTDSLEVFRELEQPFDTGWALRMLGLLEMREERYDEARDAFDEALRLFHEVPDTSGIVLLLDDFRMLAQQLGDEERAVKLFAAMERWRREYGVDLAEAEKQYDRRTDPGQDMAEARFRELYERGETMDLDEVIAYALEGDPSA